MKTARATTSTAVLESSYYNFPEKQLQQQQSKIYTINSSRTVQQCGGGARKSSSREIELSPRHTAQPGYYREDHLMSDAKLFTLNASSRFVTSTIVDNRAPILKSLFKRNVLNSHTQLMKRSGGITKYYN